MALSAQMKETADNRWLTEALTQLTGLQNEDFGWGYGAGGISSPEPTALACLAILAQGPDQEATQQENVKKAARWLSSIQQLDGSLGVSRRLQRPGWPTAYGLLTWINLPGWESHVRSALQWLLGERGEKGSETDLVNHNPKLQGWPWLSGTHSWIEPTALSVMALRRAGLTKHPRTQEGIQLILDRTIPGGGWNYGNKKMFGKDLRPQPATTGLVLMALAELDIYCEGIDRACSYLSETLRLVRSPMSLCWGILGLGAWNWKSSGCEPWLQESFQRLQGFGPATAELAYLILAASRHTWPMLAPRQDELRSKS